ncbi:DgyrCDS7655 [Dimorphilus gyrociliatus]|uniref:Crossover junction endonuclease MUS81 n=1 Tax=Dimorphilus gyrociliatus TaxID=2664684 RepID=A0A7I8VRS9_9ANNE|nr:DgyrCDS7655 [Dimorphilus gyrociliatus]
MKQDAVAKGCKTAFAYEKALRSLRKYPLVLESGAECKILDGFGSKICKVLDEKLADYVSIYGTKKPIDGIITASYTIGSISRKRTRTNPSYQAGTSDKDKKEVGEILTIEANLPNAKDTEDIRDKSSNDVKKVKHTSSDKQYIPQKGSGAYAILLTLYNESKKTEFPGFLKKDELIEKAQPLSTKSFISSENSSRYTSWSSMSTLISKNLVEKFSNPAKYKLTDAGKSLASTMNNSSGDDNFASPSSLSPAKFSEISNEYEDFVSPIRNPNLKSSCISSNSFDISSNINNFSSTPLNDDKLVSISPEKLSDNDEIQFLGETLNSSKGHTSIPITEDIEVVCVEDCKKIEKTRSFAFSDSDSDDLPDLDVFIKRKIDKNACKKPSKSTEEISYHESSSLDSYTKFNDRQKQNSPKIDELKIVESSKRNPLKTSSFTDDLEPKRPVQISETPLFTLRPNEFEIILIVDNSEHYGNQKETVVKYLDRHRIRTELRSLNVGDFLWIAREKGEPRREIVLDYIIERKRMDDLAKSICDGRYREQKVQIFQYTNFFKLVLALFFIKSFAFVTAG